MGAELVGEWQDDDVAGGADLFDRRAPVEMGVVADMARDGEAECQVAGVAAGFGDQLPAILGVVGVDEGIAIDNHGFPHGQSSPVNGSQPGPSHCAWDGQAMRHPRDRADFKQGRLQVSRR